MVEIEIISAFYDDGHTKSTGRTQEKQRRKIREVYTSLRLTLNEKVIHPERNPVF